MKKIIAAALATVFVAAAFAQPAPGAKPAASGASKPAPAASAKK